MIALSNLVVAVGASLLLTVGLIFLIESTGVRVIFGDVFGGIQRSTSFGFVHSGAGAGIILIVLAVCAFVVNGYSKREMTPLVAGAALLIIGVLGGGLGGILVAIAGAMNLAASVS